MTYIINPKFKVDCGFEVNSQHIQSALEQANGFLDVIPSIVYKNIDYKTTSVTAHSKNQGLLRIR